MSAQYPLLFNLLDVGNQLRLVLAAVLVYVAGNKLRRWQIAGGVYPLAIGCAFTSHVFAIRFGLTGSTVMTSCWVFLGLVTIRPTGMSSRLATIFVVFSSVVYVRYSGSAAPWSVGFLIFQAFAITAAVCTLAVEPNFRKYIPLCVAIGLIPLLGLIWVLCERGMDFDHQYIAENRRTF